MVSALKAGVASRSALLAASSAAGSVWGVEEPAAASSTLPSVAVADAAPFVLCSVFSNLGVFGLVVALDFSREGVLFGGLLTSAGLSCALLAELAVGRIMRARKLSSGALAGRASGFLDAAEWGRATGALGAGLLPFIDGRACLCVVGGGFGAAAAAAEAGLVVAAWVSCLAADAAVGAVRCDGTFGRDVALGAEGVLPFDGLISNNFASRSRTTFSPCGRLGGSPGLGLRCSRGSSQRSPAGLSDRTSRGEGGGLGRRRLGR